MSELLEWQAAEAIGERIIDAMDRLKDVDAAMPGSQAKLKIEVDGVEYEIIVSVVRALSQ